jgi:hypothetical protein
MMPKLYVVDLTEFLPVLVGCRKSGYQVDGPFKGYWRVRADQEITLVRKEIGLGPALWNTALAGGIRGRLAEFNRDRLVIREAA